MYCGDRFVSSIRGTQRALADHDDTLVTTVAVCYNKVESHTGTTMRIESETHNILHGQIFSANSKRTETSIFTNAYVASSGSQQKAKTEEKERKQDGTRHILKSQKQ